MKTLNILLFSLILITFVLAGFLVSEYTGKVVYEQERANITRVIDGDTLDSSLGKIRLLGINTPEKKEPDYELAKVFLQKYEGKEVILEKTDEERDKYNRLLRYVFYNNQLLNEQILALGFAHFYSYQEDRYTEQLKSAEELAREKELGIWEKSKEECAFCIKLKELNPIDPGEFVLLENNCNFDCNLQDWFIKDDASSKKILNFSIQANEQYRIEYSGRVWNDAGDSFYLRDEQGKLVIFYRY